MSKVHKINFSVDLVKFEEQIKRNSEWINWGKDNLFVDELYQMYSTNSPIHSACINAKVDAVVGQGFEIDYNVSDTQKINDIFRDIVQDYLITGNIFLETIWSNDRTTGLGGFYNIPSKYMRLGVPDEELNIDKFYYCKDWSKYRKNNIIEFCELNPKDFKTERQMVHIKRNNPQFFYGTPDYMSVFNDIKLNSEITIYNLANVTNGASPSLFINFNEGRLESEIEERQLLDALEEKYVGAENAGKIIVSFSDSAESAPTVTQIGGNIEGGYFDNIFELVQRQILSGHRITSPELLGLPSPGGFSSQAELLETAYRLWLNTTILPIQKFLIKELKPLIELVNPDQDIDLKIIQNPIL